MWPPIRAGSFSLLERKGKDTFDNWHPLQLGPCDVDGLSDGSSFACVDLAVHIDREQTSLVVAGALASAPAMSPYQHG